MTKTKNKNEGTPTPVAPQNAPEVAATANQLQQDGVVVTGLAGGVNENETPAEKQSAPDPAVAERQAREQADAQAAAGAFATIKEQRIAGVCAAMEKQGVIYEPSYIAVMPSVRDAQTEVDLTIALNDAMATLVKRHKDVTVLGGDKENFVMSDGTNLTPKAHGDRWKCPKCGSHNEMQFVNDERQPFEICPMCCATVRKDLAQNLYRVAKDGKTIQELRQEQQQQEA